MSPKDRQHPLASSQLNPSTHKNFTHNQPYSPHLSTQKQKITLLETELLSRERQIETLKCKLTKNSTFKGMGAGALTDDA